jgi:23S rRNA pseudouridine1911/1915/1917 synthase
MMGSEGGSDARGRRGRPRSSVQLRVVRGHSSPTRLIDYLAAELGMTRSEAGDLIDFGAVHLDGRRAQHPETLLLDGQDLRVFPPKRGIQRSYELDSRRILYQDKFLLAYDKEPGIPSQETPSDAYNNLFAAIKRYLASRKPAKPPYAALHHRLDRDTSGVLLVSLHPSANRQLSLAFLRKKITKLYLAWVDGVLPEDFRAVRADICRQNSRYAVCREGLGKPAETLFQRVCQDASRALVLAQPLTGRTHQIRLHLASIGHPVTGDRLYGNDPASGRLLLHAHLLRLHHPVTGELLVIQAPIPPHWPPPHAIDIPAPDLLAIRRVLQSSPD